MTECFDELINYNSPFKDNCNREYVNKNWFRAFMTYLNVKIDKFIIKLMDCG